MKYNVLNLLSEKINLWDKLKETNKPIVMYGMGNGAEKILDVCALYGIEVQDIFASDEFVRRQEFRGYTVCKLFDIEAKYDDFIILMAFAVHSDQMLDVVYALNNKYEFYAPDVPVYGDGLFTYQYVESNVDAIDQAYGYLGDDLSRKVFIDTIDYKISGKIDYLKDITGSSKEVFSNLIKLNQDEVYFDLGAYNGDTIEEFLSYTGGQYDRIYALEPDKKNFKKLTKVINKLNLNNVKIYNMAVWDSEKEISFANNGGRHSTITAFGSDIIQANSVDNILAGSRCSYIKMDVEGYEKEAIIGSVDTINKYVPKLFVAAYHRNRDMFYLINLIKGINPKYQIYLRHYPYIPAWENNIIAI